MREPLSNAESDDVLASVRRLVSRGAAETPQPRLLLSAALRVPEERDAALAAERAKQAEPAPSHDAPATLRAVPDPEPAAGAPGEAGADQTPPLTPLLLRDRVDAPAQEAAPGGAPQAEAPSVDPEALRGLVAELVREELNGAMGERVTRNLRKLVRKEVARAIASREAAARTGGTPNHDP